MKLNTIISFESKKFTYLFQALELYLAYHVYPKRTLGIFTTAVFSSTYIGWTLVVANQSGIWVYAVLEVLTPINRLSFYCIIKSSQMIPILKVMLFYFNLKSSVHCLLCCSWWATLFFRRIHEQQGLVFKYSKRS